MSLAWVLVGSAAWSASEYALHRLVGHGAKRTVPRSLLARVSPSGLLAEFNREHLAHHADPTYFAPTSRKLLAAGALLPAVTGALAPVIGVRRAASFAAGFAITYGAYEVLHRRVHTHPPKGRYGRWMRRHHLAHHYASPRDNHGVTSPVWDLVFRTHVPPERVRVPPKAAPVWLTDEHGEVRPELAADYELRRAPAR
jgi:hypothetical protein